MQETCKTPAILYNTNGFKANSTSKILTRQPDKFFTDSCLCNNVKIIIHAPDFIISPITHKLKYLFPHKCDIQFVIANNGNNDKNLENKIDFDSTTEPCSDSDIKLLYEPIYKTPIQSNDIYIISPLCEYKPKLGNTKCQSLSLINLKSKYFFNQKQDEINSKKSYGNPFEHNPSSFMRNFISPNFLNSLKTNYSRNRKEKNRVKDVEREEVDKNQSFKWSIGEKALMYPVDIENSPSFWHHFKQNDKTDLHYMYQKSIDQYFSSPINIHSPTVIRPSMVNCSTQTLVSIPFHVDVMILLQQFVKVTSEDEYQNCQDISNTSLASLRRKLFTPIQKERRWMTPPNDTPIVGRPLDDPYGNGPMSYRFTRIGSSSGKMAELGSAQTDAPLTSTLPRTPSLTPLYGKVTSSPLKGDEWKQKRILRSRTFQSPSLFGNEPGGGRLVSSDIQSPLISPIKEEHEAFVRMDTLWTSSPTPPSQNGHHISLNVMDYSGDMLATDEGNRSFPAAAAASAAVWPKMDARHSKKCTVHSDSDDISDRTRNLSLSIDEGDQMECPSTLNHPFQPRFIHRVAARPTALTSSLLCNEKANLSFVSDSPSLLMDMVNTTSSNSFECDISNVNDMDGCESLAHDDSDFGHVPRDDDGTRTERYPVTKKHVMFGLSTIREISFHRNDNFSSHSSQPVPQNLYVPTGLNSTVSRDDAPRGSECCSLINNAWRAATADNGLVIHNINHDDVIVVGSTPSHRADLQPAFGGEINFERFNRSLNAKKAPRPPSPRGGTDTGHVTTNLDPDERGNGWMEGDKVNYVPYPYSWYLPDLSATNNSSITYPFYDKMGGTAATATYPSNYFTTRSGGYNGNSVDYTVATDDHLSTGKACDSTYGREGATFSKDAISNTDTGYNTVSMENLTENRMKNCHPFEPHSSNFNNISGGVDKSRDIMTNSLPTENYAKSNNNNDMTYGEIDKESIHFNGNSAKYRFPTLKNEITKTSKGQNLEWTPGLSSTPHHFLTKFEM